MGVSGLYIKDTLLPCVTFSSIWAPNRDITISIKIQVCGEYSSFMSFIWTCALSIPNIMQSYFNTLQALLHFQQIVLTTQITSLPTGDLTIFGLVLDAGSGAIWDSPICAHSKTHLWGMEFGLVLGLCVFFVFFLPSRVVVGIPFALFCGRYGVMHVQCYIVLTLLYCIVFIFVFSSFLHALKAVHILLSYIYNF